jgi:ABC-type nitrate/sulfonate/bicarbonate transport system substrate-binding protein
LIRWPPAILLLAFACGGCRPAPVERITIGDVNLPTLALVFVAKDEGLFAAEGVDVVERRFPTGRAALDALLAGEVDVATAYETPVAGSAFSSQALRILTTLHASRSSTRVVARSDRGVRDPPSVRGKRIGVPPGTNADFFLDVFLAGAGVHPAEVQRVAMPPAEAGPMLARGEVDAVAIWLPHGREPRALGVETVELESDTYVETSMLVTRDEVAATRREALRRVLRALSRAEASVQADPRIAVAALRRVFPEVREEDLREDVARVTYQLGLSNVQLRLLERAAEWQGERRGLEGPFPNLRRLLLPELLLEVEPESVTILFGEP